MMSTPKIPQDEIQLQNRNANQGLASALKLVQNKKLVVLRFKSEVAAVKSECGPDSFLVSSLETFEKPLETAETEFAAAETKLSGFLVHYKESKHVAEKVTYLTELAQKLSHFKEMETALNKALPKAKSVSTYLASFATCLACTGTMAHSMPAQAQLP